MKTPNKKTPPKKTSTINALKKPPLTEFYKRSIPAAVIVYAYENWESFTSEDLANLGFTSL